MKTVSGVAVAILVVFLLLAAWAVRRMGGMDAPR
jgi:hypothetical protein